MSNDYLPLNIEFEGSQTEAVKVNVVRSLLVQELIQHVCQRYGVSSEHITIYQRSTDGTRRPLVLNRTLGHNDVPDHATLVLHKGQVDISPTQVLIQRNQPIPFGSTIFVHIQVELTGKQYGISWQPAIIGRRDLTQPERNKLLAVDLAGIPGANRISRHHACITRKSGQYYIESIHPQNPTYLNNRRLTPWQREPAQPGNRIRVGDIMLIFQLLE